MSRTLASTAFTLAIAGASGFVAFAPVARLPAWCLGATAGLALLFSLAAGRIAEHLSRWRRPRSIALGHVREGQSTPVEGHAFGPTRRAPVTGVASIAHRLRFLGRGGQVVIDRAESALERVVANDGAEVVIQGPVQIDWSCAASRAVLRTDDEARGLEWPPGDVAQVAVASWLPRGGRVLVVGRARSEARATERTGYRDLAPGLRVDGDAELPVTVFPLQGRWTHVWIASGLLALTFVAAIAAPWWILGILQAR